MRFGLVAVFQRIWYTEGKERRTGMEKEVMLAGMLNRIEVWSKERWDANNSYEDMDEIAAGMQDLGLNI